MLRLNSSMMLTAGFLLLCAGSAIPDSTGNKDRVVTEKPLSDEEHYNEGEHNAEYDHEAFLGENAAKTFDQLSPEESKERLGKIVDKIDADGDKFVTYEELKNWIRKTQKLYIMTDVEKQWQTYQPKNDDKLTWDEYRTNTYGYQSDDEADNDIEEGAHSYREMMIRDKRRWTTADQDKDGLLSKTEFGDFLHPEEAEHMKPLVVTETLEDIDKDKDGQISLSEYIGDMYEGTEETEPDWVKNEREQFINFRDLNKDGVMDRDEVQAWIVPQDYDNADAEAKHLLSHSDANNDEKLTKEEILDKYDLFVGSQATDYGEALTESHDEL